MIDSYITLFFSHGEISMQDTKHKHPRTMMRFMLAIAVVMAFVEPGLGQGMFFSFTTFIVTAFGYLTDSQLLAKNIQFNSHG